MNRSGWAYGDRMTKSTTGELSDWLTILGSAYRRPELHATRELAEKALDDAGIRHAKHMNIVVAHVTEVRYPGVSGGYAYRISQAAGLRSPETPTDLARCGIVGPHSPHGTGPARCSGLVQHNGQIAGLAS